MDVAKICNGTFGLWCMPSYARRQQQTPSTWSNNDWQSASVSHPHLCANQLNFTQVKGLSTNSTKCGITEFLHAGASSYPAGGVNNKNERGKQTLGQISRIWQWSVYFVFCSLRRKKEKSLQSNGSTPDSNRFQTVSHHMLQKSDDGANTM